jgi:hypothetical protein
MTREAFYNLWNVVAAIKAGEASLAEGDVKISGKVDKRQYRATLPIEMRFRPRQAIR